MADKELNVEDDILNSIGEGPKVEDQTDGEEGNDQGNESVESESGGKTKETKDSSSGTEAKPGNKNDKQGVGAKPGTKQAAGPQDLIGADGKVIAKAGAERRFYEESQRLKQDNGKLKTQIQELTTKVTAFESANNVGKEYGLQPNEMIIGAQIVAAWKKDVPGTIKHLLTQAQAMGYDLADLAPSGVSPEAMKQMMQEMLYPILSDRQKQADEQKLLQEADTQYQQFVTQYPDSRIHESTIADLMEKDPSLSPEVAYWRVKAFYAERGLDWSKPLSVLVEEAKKQAQQGTKQTNRETLPRGVILQEDEVDDTETEVGASTSFDDIIRQSMKGAGLKI